MIQKEAARRLATVFAAAAYTEHRAAVESALSKEEFVIDTDIRNAAMYAWIAGFVQGAGEAAEMIAMTTETKIVRDEE